MSLQSKEGVHVSAQNQGMPRGIIEEQSNGFLQGHHQDGAHVAAERKEQWTVSIWAPSEPAAQSCHKHYTIT